MRDTFGQHLKEGDEQFGRFYPKGYIFAVFPSEAIRAEAGAALAERGWASDDLIEFSGEDLLIHHEELAAKKSLLSSILGKFADRDKVYTEALAIAQRDPDSRFMLVYAPQPDVRARATEALLDRAILAQSFDTFSFSQIPVQSV